MKRFTLFVFLVAMVTSPMMAERVTPETARKVATTFLTNNGAKTTQLTDLSKTAGFQNLYIFNGNPGFVVMSADDRVQPILGYSIDNAVTTPLPPHVNAFLHSYEQEIAYYREHNFEATEDIISLWNSLLDGEFTPQSVTVVTPMLTTTWDQSPLYNNLCPDSAGQHAVTGCAATATATTWTLRPVSRVPGCWTAAGALPSTPSTPTIVSRTIWRATHGSIPGLLLRTSMAW